MEDKYGKVWMEFKVMAKINTSGKTHARRHARTHKKTNKKTDAQSVKPEGSTSVLR